MDVIPPKLDYHRRVKTPGHWSDEMHLWAPGAAFIAFGLAVLGLVIFAPDEFNALPVLLVAASFLLPGVWLLTVWHRSIRARNTF